MKITEPETVDAGIPHGPAIAELATRSAIKRYSRLALGSLAFGFVLLVLEARVVIAHPWSGRGVGFGLGLGASCAAGGALMLWRWSRWNRLLSNQPWREYHCTFLPAVPQRANAGVLLDLVAHQADSEPIPLRLDVASPRSRAKLQTQHVVWACGDVATNVVITTPHRRFLIAAGAPRGYFGRRWTKLQEPKIRAITASDQMQATVRASSG